MWVKTEEVSELLKHNHYLGPTRRGVAWLDEFGVIVIGTPSSRRLPKEWAELSRWCITSKEKNAGSRQWAAFVRAVRKEKKNIKTIVSYSDPSVGHTGALYRACNWQWAPTWHRLRPPPSGNGRWGENRNAQNVKDRWVFPVSKDQTRQQFLKLRDSAMLRAYPWAEYREGRGADYAMFAQLLFARSIDATVKSALPLPTQPRGTK